MFKKVPLVSQTRENDCGLCCISMIMQFFGDKVYMSTLSNIINLQDNGLSIKDIKIILNSFDYNVKAYKCSIKGLSKISETPLILHWDNSHYVILEKIKKDKYIILDPASGKKSVSYNEFKKHFSEVILLISPPLRDKIKENKNDLYIYKSFFKNNKKDSIKLLFLIFLDVSISLSAIIFIFSLIIQAENLNIAFFITMTIIYIAFLLWVNTQVSIFSEKLGRYVYQSVTEKLFTLPYSYFSTRSVGNIFYRLNLIKTPKEFLVKSMMSFVKSLVIVVTILIMLMHLDKGILLMILILNTILILGTLYFKKREDKYLRVENSENYTLEYIEKTILSLFFNIKVMRQEEFNKKQLFEQYEKSSYAFQKRFLFSENIKLVKLLNLYWAPTVAILILLSRNSKEEIIPSIYIIFLVIIYFVCINNLLLTPELYNSFKENLDKTNDIIDYENEKLEDSKKVIINNIEKIEFINVYFCYPNKRKPILENINFTINKGENTILTGAKGSGKSTILSLIFGLYKPSKGNIYINDINIKDVNMSSFKKLITFVPENSFLINGTIKDNISMHHPHTQKEIDDICKDIGIHEVIIDMPMSYETIIESSNINISETLQKKIMCARILLQNSEVLLVDNTEIINLLEKHYYNYESLQNEKIIVGNGWEHLKDEYNIISIDNGTVKQKHSVIE